MGKGPSKKGLFILPMRLLSIPTLVGTTFAAVSEPRQTAALIFRHQYDASHWVNDATTK